MNETDWTWKFTQRATDQFEELDTHIQDRIVSKLDEVVESEWRDPSDYLEPLTGGPFSKLRIGQYRLACVLDYDDRVLAKYTGSNTEAVHTQLTIDIEWLCFDYCCENQT